MASRNFSRVQGLNKELKLIAGQFSDAAKVQGLGYSVANTATGQYTITLEDKYSALISGTMTVEADTGEDIKCVIISHDVTASSPVIVVETQTAGSAADLVGDDAVHFLLVLQNSSVESV